jgi:hypothetical protein
MVETFDKARDLRQQLDELKKERKNREAVWQDVIDYILPGLETILLQDTDDKGKRIGINRYDGTGISAHQLLCDGLYGYMVSPAIPWLMFRMQKEELNQIKEVKRWLQDLEAHYYSVFDNSNFYESISSAFEYATAFGFTDMYSEEVVKEGKINFSVYHPGEIYVADNQFGFVDRVFRECHIEAYKAKEMFGEENLGEHLRDCLKNGKNYERFKFLHAVYPRKDRDTNKSDSKNMPYASTWLQLEGFDRATVGQNGLVVKESGYKMNPHHVWRFKRGVTPYGMGPAEEALIEVMFANEIGKTLALAAHKSVEPPLNVPSELQGRVDIRPSGMNYYSDAGKIIQPIQTGINFPVGVDREERTQKAIEKHFKVEFFMLLSSLEGKGKTATEIIELQGEKAAVLGRPITRLNNECLNPIIERVFLIEQEAKRLPEMPPILKEALAGERVIVDFMGPLAQAQRKLFQMQGINQGLASAIPLIQLFPEAKDLIDPDETMRTILYINNFPVKAVKDKMQVEKLRKERMAIMQQQQAKEDLAGMAQMGKDMAEVDAASDGQLGEALGQVMGQQ